MPEPSALFFATPAQFRRWLERHHTSARELWVGFYKKQSRKPSITWPEAVDEALCFGWIDGIRKSIDVQSYKIRFTPRKPRSNWSAVNIARVEELTRSKRMRAAGLDAFTSRAPERCGIYAYENRDIAHLDDAAEKHFRSNTAAWKFFQQQPASYRKTATWWVVSAKRAETKQKRLETLMADSAANQR